MVKFVIKEVRKARGITQAKLAERIGSTQRNVSNWENGVCEPDIATLYLIAEVLEVEMKELFLLEKKEGA